MSPSESYPWATAPMHAPDIIAWNAENYPTAPCYLFAPIDPSAPAVNVTHLEFSRASQRAAHLLRPNRAGPDDEVVAIIALSDTLVYLAIIAGLMTANCVVCLYSPFNAHEFLTFKQPFPISPRNSPAAVVNLLQKTSCHRILSTRVKLDALLVGVKEELAQLDPYFVLTIEEIPSVSQIYPNMGAESPQSPFDPYPSGDRPAWDDVCIYLHSSGSTGMPKAIPETNRVIWQWSTLTTLRDMRDTIGHPLAGMAIPPFHMSGILVQFLTAVHERIPVALFPPTATSPDALPVFPSPENVLEHSRRTGCKSMILLPFFIVAWAQSAESVEYLRTLSVVGFGGGALPERVGNTLVEAGVKIRSIYAGTEFGAVSSIVPSDGDEKLWEWMRFSDEITVQWDLQGDEMFECQLLTSDRHTVSVENMKGARGYATSDLWINHPEKKYLWKMVGRIDDVIVHSSGEKTVPTPMEDIVLSSPNIAGAVMFGWEHDQAGILIEPIPALGIDINNAIEVGELRNKIWPIIEEANQVAPAFSRIFKEMIIFTAPEKPMPRTGKGTVMRKATLKVYSPEIDALYNIVEEKASVDTSKMPAVWELPLIQRWLLELAAELTDLPEISIETDLFHQGFDSLSATFLRRRIIAAFRASKDPALRKVAPDISQNLIYSHPTISQLSAHLDGLISGASGETLDAKQLIKSLVNKHASGLSGMVPVPCAADFQTVLLTGSTGSLGSQIMSSLLQDDRVVKVYALNRPSSSGHVAGGSSFLERHTVTFRDRGLDINLLNSPKLHFIRNSVTLIIHNAWKLDFNLSLASFENHIVGTRHLVDLALSSPRTPRFLFTSSIASAISWNPAQGPCPETLLIEDGINEGSTGYGQSKFVAEQILARSGLRATSLRIGQICGSVSSGAWATSDWLPILVKTSLTLGCLPLADGVVSWIDFENVTNVIMDVAFARATEPVYNLVHPRPVSWNFIVNALRDAILKRTKCTPEFGMVPFSDWIAKLQVAAEVADAKELPGIKLVGFFNYLAKASATSSKDSEFGGMDFSTGKIRANSSTVQMMEPIGVGHVNGWVGYWIASGLI
ncbi:General substrate transporter [Mycena sanguinolenta]|uniref:General substrate transporter n=1 Tax=Mycena sanguinolenta TaxID=230812 RepID=A0A8H6ZAC1_9AGAR|nr:General substrate transporter [Mycena sanguinolenta]